MPTEIEKKTNFTYLPDGVISVTEVNDQITKTKLVPAVYNVMRDDQQGYFLKESTDKMPMPKKIYGDLNFKATYFLKGYDNTDKSMGIILEGLKGTGKTQLTNILANRLIDKGIPTLVVGSPFYGKDFETFINRIGECCLLMDEFSQVYEHGKDAKLLSFFDGAADTKRLSIITTNNALTLNTYYLGRPNRHRYLISFKALDKKMVSGYLRDTCKKMSKERRNELSDYFKSIKNTINFDTLSVVTEEAILRPDYSISDIVSVLNTIEPDIKEMEIISTAGIKKNKVHSAQIKVEYSSRSINAKIENESGSIIQRRMKVEEITGNVIKTCTGALGSNSYSGVGSRDNRVVSSQIIIYLRLPDDVNPQTLIENSNY